MKLRRHLFEEIEVTLDHPGVRMSKPLERQYQAALEVVVADEDALSTFATSPAWNETVDGLARHCEAVHAARVDRCITTKYRGAITLAGVRVWLSPTSSDALGGAQSQRESDVSTLFLPGKVRLLA